MSTNLDTLRSMLSTAKSDQTAHKHRLADLKQDYKADPWEDTAAQIKRTETRLWSGEIRIKALEYAVNVVASVEEDVRGCSCGMDDYGTPGHDGGGLDAEETAELTRLEAEFEEAGGRGVELAERIDALRLKRGDSPEL